MSDKKLVPGPKMLPGMAMIAIFMLVISIGNAFSAARNTQARPSARYAILALCSLIVVGVFGFLRLRRWGWALLAGGAFFYSLGNVVLFLQMRPRQVGYLLPAAFTLVFFLYLIRDEVRDRVH
ncbi:hypothetical protein [Terriglobus saanensis]|uniref:Uncharacterized protein n=1 Tax=Terriglobus saanensis (strain ATCC BAA-1853 / DSM 23119 / SP1PR4) TaxID=401053 RepID=E8V3N9_TERSS|nr:hypothetical protein [Terriglobus saanensis]ADV84726.1 hypothetical protein AciPR4_3977 [Terriglobus saanensis SP1PR4]